MAVEWQTGSGLYPIPTTTYVEQFRQTRRRCLSLSRAFSTWVLHPTAMALAQAGTRTGQDNGTEGEGGQVAVWTAY